MTDDSWDGTERRAVDHRFERAITDVRALKAGVADLADAVRVKSDTLHKVMVRIAVLVGALFVAIVVTNVFFVKGLNDHMDHGHDTLTCLLLIEPPARTAQSLIDCQRGP
jgi:hypothetical protein